MGGVLALATNIRLDWKGLPGTNSLTYYEHLEITDVKSFKTLALGLSLKRLVSSQIAWHDKLDRLPKTITLPYCDEEKFTKDDRKIPFAIGSLSVTSK